MSAGLVYVLYSLFALGAVGLYLAMPGPSRARVRGGSLLAAAAVVGLLTLLGMRFVAPHASNVYFYIFGGLAILAAGRVVTHPKPVYSAVYFGLVVLCVAVLLVVQRAEFLAVALIIIYAGAILVTYAFVIMLAQQSGAATADIRSREPLLAVCASFVAFATLCGRVGELQDLPVVPAEYRIPVAVEWQQPALDEAQSVRLDNTTAVGRAMFGKYIVAIELAGVLLLVAMVGAIAIAKKRIPVQEIGPPAPAPGSIGRAVPPF